ncbi:hypothetical protein [Spongiibacter marinus]|uniref:hypothetical protein n=1 Tax=Spongiibacter marinus TaxID=354246 RepID=UPI003563BE8F
MDELQLLIALFALLLGIWNYSRLSSLDEKKEYKDKRFLYRDCAHECSELLERITLETEELIVRHANFDLLGSPYIGSHGYQQAHSTYIAHLREIQTCRVEITEIYTSLKDLLLLPDKESFDSCIAKQREVKDLFLRYINSYAGAKSQLDGVEKMALYMSNKA